ncbi:hypothetical protein BDV23DRAFT_164085 [Aspergillus alliaceus]|uniref:Uncharacterized protein n=1 Tax=Petromyces alliaceus TaxID=209559 RepID=A0A5N7BVU7_PETAA|nr:hypothetical protein BDV23DRAFT_164085 [Aspergillus alliaceus]
MKQARAWKRLSICRHEALPALSTPSTYPLCNTTASSIHIALGALIYSFSSFLLCHAALRLILFSFFGRSNRA